MTIRAIGPGDGSLLEGFLYGALFLPPGIEPPTREVIYDPAVYIYIDNFGSFPGDCGFLAEIGGRAVGAAWVRHIEAYGHIDGETPELAISVLPACRGQGIGSALMARLFDALKRRGCARTSLSVQKQNPAARLYLRLGYEIVRENEEDYLMVKEL